MKNNAIKVKKFFTKKTSYGKLKKETMIIVNY